MSGSYSIMTMTQLYDLSSDLEKLVFSKFSKLIHNYNFFKKIYAIILILYVKRRRKRHKLHDWDGNNICYPLTHTFEVTIMVLIIIL